MAGEASAIIKNMNEGGAWHRDQDLREKKRCLFPMPRPEIGVGIG